MKRSPSFPLFLLIALAQPPALGLPSPLRRLDSQTPVAVPPTSPRDLYIDAWFKETAESDFKGALELYERCAALAAPTDRELAGKALLRMSRIATARGDHDAAMLLLDRIAAEFQETAAARQAQAGAVGTPSASAGAEATDVAEARRMLDEMLRVPGAGSPRRCELVLRALGIQGVLTFAEERGWSASNFFLFIRPQTLSEAEWVDLALRRSSDLHSVAIGKLAKLELARIPDAILSSLNTKDPSAVAAVIRLCVTVGTDEAMSTLLNLLEGSPDPENIESSLFFGLEGKQSAAADRAFEIAFARFQSKPDFAQVIEAQLEPNSSDTTRELPLFAPTRFARALRSAFPGLPIATRIHIAEATVLDEHERYPADLVPLLLADPDPAVRLRAIGRRLFSSDSAIRRDAARRLQHEPRPIDTGLLNFVFGSWRDVPLAEMLDELSGPLLEFAYWQVLRLPQNPPVATLLRLAMERKHAELYNALFDLRFDRSGELSGLTIGDGKYLPIYGFFGRQTFDRRLASDPNPDLAFEFLSGMFAIPDEMLWLRTLEALRNTGDVEPRVLDLFTRADSPRVMLEIASKADLERVTDHALQRILSAPDRATRRLALERVRNASRLIPSAASAGDADLDAYLKAAERLDSSKLALEILKRVPEDSIDALRCLRLSIDREPDALIIALERGSFENRLGQAARLAFLDVVWRENDPEPYTLDFARGEPALIGAPPSGSDPRNSYVVGKLRGIAITPALAKELKDLDTSPKHDSWSASVLSVLTARREEWAAGLASLTAQKILAQARVNLGDGKQVAARLADLGLESVALELLDSDLSVERTIGLRTLASLGKKAPIVEYAGSHANPNEWLVPMILVGAREQLLAMISQGRLTEDEVLRPDEVKADPALVTDLVAGPRRVSLQDSSAPTFGTVPWRLQLAIDTLTANRDSDRLLRLVAYYDSADAVRALFSLTAIDRILNALPDWSAEPCRVVEEEMRKRTGLPESPFSGGVWSQRSHRVEWAATWRKALAK